MAAVVNGNHDEESKVQEVNEENICDSALLVIDVQKDYYSNDKHVKGNFPDFRQPISSLLSTAREMVQKKQLHIIHTKEIDNEDSLWMAYWDEMNPKSLAKYAKGEAEDFCKVENGEKLVIKRTFDAFHETELQEYLQNKGIKTLYFCGLVTSMCVLHSVLSAFARGYRTFIIGDCCGDWKMENHSAILKVLDGNMAKVITLKQFESMIQSKDTASK